MAQSVSLVGNLKNALNEVNANWQAYAAISTSQEITDTGVEFVAETQAAWDQSKQGLVDAFGVLAGGMGTTVADLLVELGNGSVQKTP